MNPDEELEMQRQADQEKQFIQARLQTEQMNASLSMDEQNTNMIREQLDISAELKMIDNLLRGKFQTTAPDGRLIWKDPLSNEDVLLTEAGINLVLNSIQWYINKNTLLSNYDEKTIMAKMEDFATSLADNLFMKSEMYFLEPTTSECQKKLTERLRKKLQARVYTLELQGVKANEDEIWKQLISEIDPDIEREKIKEQIRKNKLKGFDLLMRVIQDAVHSTYLRALGGQERRTLRQHIHISENLNPNLSNKQQNVSSPSNWFKR